MNLQESIRRILREDKDHTNLLKGIIDSSDIFDYKHFCGFDIITPEERSDQYNFLNKNKIPYLIKVYFVGGPNSEVWPRTQAIRNKELDLMEELHEYIKSFVPFNIEMMGSHVNSCEGYDKLMKRKYSTDDLQESIRRILREEIEFNYGQDLFDYHKKENLPYHSKYKRGESIDYYKKHFIDEVKKHIVEDNQILLYRVVATKKEKDIKKPFGTYWAFKKEDSQVIDWENIKDTDDLKLFRITALFNLSDINWKDSFDLYLMNDFMESEIRVNYGANPEEYFIDEL